MLAVVLACVSCAVVFALVFRYDLVIRIVRYGSGVLAQNYLRGLGSRLFPPLFPFFRALLCNVLNRSCLLGHVRRSLLIIARPAIVSVTLND